MRSILVQVPRYFIFVLLSFSWQSPTHAMGKKGKLYLMASAGDSITAGSLADTTSNPWVGEFSTPTEENPPREESASRSIRTYIFYETKDTFSWASGKWIDSHYVHLRDYLRKYEPDSDLDVLNVAIPGNQSKDLDAQADRILAAMGSKQYAELKYLTLLIGANDACALTPPRETAANVRRFFEKISQVGQKERIRILVSGLPPIPVLGKKEVLEHRTAGIFTCKYMRGEVFKFCGTMTTWQTEEEFDRKMREILDFNEVIRAVIQESMAVHPNLDIRFSESFTRYEVPLGFLAIDCFHPNWAGQSEISDFLWRDQPWFKP